MTKYVLHGGKAKIDNDSNRSFFKELVKDVPDKGNVLLIYFAYDKDPTEEVERIKSWMTEGAKPKTLNFTIAERDSFVSELKNADAVYFRGGETKILLDIAREIPNFEELLDGKVVGGSSAGAYMFSTYYHSATYNQIRKGLSILPIRVVCHYQSDEYNSREEAVKEMDKYPNDLELVVLKDSEWRVFEK